MRIFLAKQNSDMTEGRGPMKTIGYYDNIVDAYDAVKGRGVMGVGDGEIVVVEMNQNPPRITEETVYGYRRGHDGKWGNGWANGYGPDPDAGPAKSMEHDLKDPDYRMYLALKARYEQ